MYSESSNSYYINGDILWLIIIRLLKFKMLCSNSDGCRFGNTSFIFIYPLVPFKRAFKLLLLLLVRSGKFMLSIYSRRNCLPVCWIYKYIAESLKTAVPKFCRLVAWLEGERRTGPHEWRAGVCIHAHMQFHTRKREEKLLGHGLDSFMLLHVKSFCKDMEGLKQCEIAPPKPFLHF